MTPEQRAAEECAEKILMKHGDSGWSPEHFQHQKRGMAAIILPYVSQTFEHERYGEELDKIGELLQALHPIGQVKGIGRLECAEALKQVSRSLALEEEPSAYLVAQNDRSVSFNAFFETMIAAEAFARGNGNCQIIPLYAKAKP